MDAAEVYSKISATGISKEDARVIADCIITRKVCSWVNNELLDTNIMMSLHKTIMENNYKISIIVDPVPTRNKYIWEVKLVK